VTLQWFSFNMSISTFTMGAVAVPVFGLGFVDSVLIILLVNFVGALAVALFSAFGAKFGLRQMILSRFFFGHYMSKLRMSSPPRLSP
jgi:purine-cytosine permease-like protein